MTVNTINVNGNSQAIEDTTARKTADTAASNVEWERQNSIDTYTGQSLASVFQSEIGSTHIATWLRNRVRANNFAGMHIKDYVDIVCDGVTMRYRIGAIDPYYGCADQQKGHHIVMVPDSPWALSEAKDGEFAISENDSTAKTYLKWNNTADNNGTAEEKHPYLCSNLHKWEIEKMLPRFPQEWQDAMLVQRVLLEERFNASSKLQDSGGWSWADLGKIWSPSETEVYGQCVWGTKGYSVGMDCQFPIFKQSRDRIGRSGSPVRVHWWLRSVVAGSTSNVCGVNNGGTASNSSATHTWTRPLPCFLVG